jgi:acetylornithine deacetylase/succinyl-diaminopimelate desuccinylase-like protein
LKAQSRPYDALRAAARERVEAVANLTATICRVPSPTGAEAQRAACVADLLHARGYRTERDEVGNVYARRGTRGGPVLMLLCHLDTVFPETTSITIQRDGDTLRGPAIGDNSLGIAATISAFDVLDQLALETATDVLMVANVGEEGLGNLRGARAAVDRHRQELGAVLAVEGHNLGRVTNTAVGSKRWRITVRGPGGHSWGAFGEPNAIHGLARAVAQISELRPPEEPRTTFNVGVIQGGTTVNTIAAEASCVLDLRSVDPAALDHIDAQVRAILKRTIVGGLRYDVEALGERPAGSLADDHPLVQTAMQTLSWLGIQGCCDASSTDANVPLSQGIPAVCIGITRGGRGHSVEEFIQVMPIADGVAQLLRLCVDVTDQLSAGTFQPRSP